MKKSVRTLMPNLEKVHNGVRYTLSNEYQKGDKVYPLLRGRCLDDGGYVIHNIDFRDFMSGFPDEPHIVLDMSYSTSKPEEIKTDHGYGPSESYFKIIKTEVKGPAGQFGRREWIKITEE